MFGHGLCIYHWWGYLSRRLGFVSRCCAVRVLAPREWAHGGNIMDSYDPLPVPRDRPPLTLPKPLAIPEPTLPLPATDEEVFTPYPDELPRPEEVPRTNPRPRPARAPRP